MRRSTAPNSDAVRSTGKRGPRFRAPFCGMSVFEGGPARNRVVFINSRRGHGEKGALPGSRGAADLALYLQVARGRQTRGSEGSLQEPSADKNLPISGRSPLLFCHEGSRGVLARANARIEPSDTYAWAVMSVGPGALLYGESVISMLGLAPTNPTRMFVATPRRTRRKLPDSIKVEWLRGIKPTATYNGIPCQSAQDAILSCKGKMLPDRLEAAAQAAREQGLINKQQYHTLKKELRSENAH